MTSSEREPCHCPYPHCDDLLARISSLEAELESYKATLELLPMYNQVVARAEAAEEEHSQCEGLIGYWRETAEKAVELLRDWNPDYKWVEKRIIFLASLEKKP